MEELRQNTLIRERYRLKKKLGEGSFGEVWLAEDTLLGGLQVALKFYQRTDADGQAAFTREYTRVLPLKHENLLTASHFDFYERRPFLVMDYCESGAVTRLRGHMNEQQIWQFVHDVAAGLAYMHQQSPPIIHQDIKPANVLLHGSGRFVVTDFGISRSTLSSSGSSEALKSAGTVAYMGPERFSQTPETIMASDVWSLGASAYELAAGECPFEGRGGVALKMGFEMPNLPREFSSDLDAMVKACMAREPWDRPRAAQIVEYAAAKLRGEHPSATWKMSKRRDRTKPRENSNHKIALPKIETKKMLMIAAAVVVGIIAIVIVANSGKKRGGGENELMDTVETTMNSSVMLPYGTWTGRTEDGLPHGQGEIAYLKDDADGRERYVGEMEKGERQGYGVLTYTNGDKFDGQWVGDKMAEGVFVSKKQGMYFMGRFDGATPYEGAWYAIEDNEMIVAIHEGKQS